MKVLVTGGAGFIGSHLTERLLDLGHTVTVVDDLSSGSLDNLRARRADPRLGVCRASAADRRTMDRLGEGCDVIFHLAARVGVRHYVENPLDVVQTNVHTTEVVLEAALRHRTKVVFASTSEVYGKNVAVPYDEEADRVLGSTRRDRWCYATAKAVDEHLCFAYERLGLPVVIVRYFNAYGPRALANAYGGVLVRFVRQSLAGEPITVYGDGAQSRTFTYVDDIVSGTLAAATAADAAGEAFNLGSDDEITIGELAALVKEAAGSASPIVRIPYREAFGDRYEDVRRRVPSIEKARRRLGYRPTVALRDGLRATIEWFRRRAAAEA
jgi:UDP-glucose 4-epimerase